MQLLYALVIHDTRSDHQQSRAFRPSYADCQSLVMRAPHGQNHACLSLLLQATTPEDIMSENECHCAKVFTTQFLRPADPSNPAYCAVIEEAIHITVGEILGWLEIRTDAMPAVDLEEPCRRS